MAYKITDGCIGCGACEGTCPVGAISNDGSVCVISTVVGAWDVSRMPPQMPARVARTHRAGI